MQTLTASATVITNAQNSAACDTPSADLAPRYRRRHYLIDMKLQGRFFLTMLGLTGVVAFAAVVLAAHYLLPGAGAAPLSASALQSALVRVALGAAVFAMLVLPVASVFLSHRIAGPAYRFRKTAQEVASGQFDGHIYLRRFDYMKPTAEAMNAMLDSLKARQQTTEQNQTVAAASLQIALKQLSSDDPLAVAEALHLVEDAMGRLHCEPAQ